MTTNARAHLPWLLLLANAAVFGIDQIAGLELAVLITVAASIVILIAIHGRNTLQRPVVVIVVAMAALAMVDLADAGLVPVVRI